MDVKFAFEVKTLGGEILATAGSRQATGAGTVIDERSRAEPELRAVLAGRVHDAEVVLAVPEQHVFLALRELSDASNQILDLVVSLPVKQNVDVCTRLYGTFRPTAVEPVGQI